MKRILSLVAALALSAGGLFAEEIIFVNACYNTAVNSDDSHGCGAFNAWNGLIGANTSASTSSSISAVTTPCPRIRSIYKTQYAAPLSFSWVVTPETTIAGGVYMVYMSIPSSSTNCSDVLFDVTSTNAYIQLDANATNSTPVGGVTGKCKLFQRGSAAENRWAFLGIITNYPNTARPTLMFTWQADPSYGTVWISPNAYRLVADVFYFQQIVPPPCSPIPNLTILAPLATNLTNVIVSGVVTNATNITIYQSSSTGMVQIARLAGTNWGTTVSVPVAAGKLTKGAQVVATQTCGGMDGCVPSAGAFVGSGVNPRLRFALSVREDTSLTGPIGADGGATSGTRIFFVGTSSTIPALYPVPGTDAPVLHANNGWQTITLTPNVSPEVVWNGASGNPITGNYGVLEALAVAIDDTTDTGPYKFYLDDLKCGSTVIQDWEAATNGATAYGFEVPSYSGSTSANLLPNLSEAVVTNEVAASGSKALRVQFQYADTNNYRWVRLTTLAAGGTPNPEIDLTKPLSIKVYLGAQPLQGSITVTNVTATSATLVWNSGTLQSASILLGTNTPWADVTGATSPYAVTTSSGSAFYRLR